MVKDHTIKDLPFAEIMTAMNIEALRDKFQEEDMKMTISAIKKHIPKNAKVKFYAE